jgi:tetratricopeptide (TPR) repeat protein
MLKNMVRSGVACVMGVLALTIANASHAAGTKNAAAATTAATADPVKLSEFLVKPAEQAVKDRNFSRAIALYRGIVAIRGDGDEMVWKLAEAWQLAGRFTQAADELTRYENAVTDPEKKESAADQIKKLAAQTEGYDSYRKLLIGGADKEAKQAFALGTQYANKKQWLEASLLFRAGVIMAPDVVGNIRKLGDAYDKLGKADEANQFFNRYLRQHPFGKNADEVRHRLQLAKQVGSMAIESALPCEQVWVNGQQAPMKLPVKKIDMAAGDYKLLCYSEKYHFAQYAYGTVAVGGAVTVSFQWAIVKNKLDPWGRIALEDPNNPKVMVDVGQWDEFGVQVPDDRRSLKVHLKAGDGSQEKDILVKLEAGKTVEITWK